MRRVVAIAVIAEFYIVALLLANDIQDFMWTHPSWHSYLSPYRVLLRQSLRIWNFAILAKPTGSEKKLTPSVNEPMPCKRNRTIPSSRLPI